MRIEIRENEVEFTSENKHEADAIARIQKVHAVKVLSPDPRKNPQSLVLVIPTEDEQWGR